MSFRFNLKKVVIAASLIAIAVTLFLIHALAGLGSSAVVFAEPPAFVEQYVSERFGIEITPQQEDVTTNFTKDYFNEAALVRNVMVNGEPTDQLIELFNHADKEKRVKIAFAFSEVNIKLSHDDVTGFDDKRKQFWEEVSEHSEAMQNALFEALITSAQEGTRTFIPYTLAWWMQEQKTKALEMLVWAAKHHPDSWVRNFSVYYVVQFGDNEEHAVALLEDRVHDPVFKVRKQVLEQRIRRFKESVFGKEE